MKTPASSPAGQGFACLESRAEMKRKLLLRGIRQLVTVRGPAVPRRGRQLGEPGIITDGAVLIEQGRIAQIGPSARIENLAEARGAEELACPGQVVIPGFVDSHTHLVHGPPRLDEYEMRIRGASYEEIAAAGGGILTSMRAIRAAPASRLRYQAARALRQAASFGITTVEAKSGYGLDEAAELKVLRILKTLHGEPVSVVPTFLGPHAVPPEFAGRPDEFIDFLIGRPLPRITQRRLARFADAYCDRNAFTVDQTRRFLAAAKERGLGLRLHASQFSNLGAVALAAELGALSVDHLEAIEQADIDIVARSSLIATLLPGSVFHLGLSRYAPARALIDAGAAVALATDFNPGSSPSISMPFVLSLACTQMRMTPAEALAAATINGAHALGLAAETGSLEHGKWADLVALEASDYRELPYYFGMNPVSMTMRRGEIVYMKESSTCP
ncbi:MAG: imidazolonepropionase [Bryobacteraceae bacterium]|nr:imidazolonepropionase [Bryobacteraceae bacterium]